MALTNAFISAVKSNIRRLGSSLSGGSLSDLGAAAQKINAEILNARNRTSAALSNIDRFNTNTAAARLDRDILDYNNRIENFTTSQPRGQILNWQQSPVERYPILQPGTVQQDGIIIPPKSNPIEVINYGAIADQQKAAAALAEERTAKRSEAARKGAATRRAKREQAIADNHIYNLQAQANLALAKQNIRSTAVSAPDASYMRSIVQDNLNAVANRQRAAYGAGQQVRAEVAAEKAAAIGQKQADSLRLHQVTNDARANHRAEIADSEAVAEQSKRIAENNAQIELHNARKLAAQNQVQNQERLQQYYRDKAGAAMKIANVSPVTGKEAKKLASEAEELANRERIQASGDTFDIANNNAIKETQEIREDIQRIQENENAARTIGFTDMYNSAKEEENLRNFVRQNIAPQVKKDQEFLAANPLREGQDIESMKAGYDNIMSTVQKIREGEITWNPGDFKDFDLKEFTGQINNDKAVIDASDRLQNAATVKKKFGIEDVGSGKTLQETAAVSAQDQAVASAASDFSGAFPSFEKAMSGDGNVSLDRAILRSKMGGDPSDWGFEGGSNHLLTNQEKDFNKFIKDLRKSNASPEQKQKLFNDKLFEIQKNIAEGPGMSDFFFGNQLHTGAIGAAAIMGTMGVAFGGRKSNAELYSSPF